MGADFQRWVCVCVCVGGGQGGGCKFHSRQISWGWWWKFLWLVRVGRDFLEADQVAHIRGEWAGVGRGEGGGRVRCALFLEPFSSTF